MKSFNPEKLIGSEIKFIFMFLWAGILLFLMLQGNTNGAITLHPWLAGITGTNIQAAPWALVVFRLLLIAISVILAYQISVTHFEIPRKDYTLSFVLPLIQFTITDWSFGLVAAFYWVIFLSIIYLLLPSDSHRPYLRKIMTAALLGGLLLLNGAFALLFYFVGLVILIAWNNFSLRSLIIWTTGFLLPATYVLFYYFLTDQLFILQEGQGAFFLTDNFLQFDFSLALYGTPVLLFFLVIMVHGRLSEFKISVRRSLSSLLFAILMLLPAILSTPDDNKMLFALLGFSVALYWNKALYITRRKLLFIILWLISVAMPLAFFFALEKFQL